jgi:hypothetical protein
MYQADAEMVFVLSTAFGALGAMGVELRASSSVFRTSQIGPLPDIDSYPVNGA